ncbi:LLM class F420-dependent oxidoreductase [Streptosporangium sp. OZ121]|uniref:LLM class F420-dependent oxidoreductase n=1 Tax=Streptosporangium sp. OZ121 TaxID=3444183 RepID=UPI003F79808B
MRIGFALPQIGRLARPSLIITTAVAAEELGYDSLWVLERLLKPVHPRTPYPGTPDGRLPEALGTVFDPLSVLSFAAARTESIALGTSVLCMPLHNPVMLAKQLATIDVLSGGRLRVGLGLGWSEDEYEAAGTTSADRGRKATEFVKVLKELWTADKPAFHGEFYRVAESEFRPRPVQTPHPPLYLAAFDERALRRAGRLADGWNPAALPAQALTPMMDQVRAAAEAEGRDPGALQMIVRANAVVTESPLDHARQSFHGTWEQISDDVRAVRDAGADEIFFDFTLVQDDMTGDEYVRLLKEALPRVRDAIGSA